MLEKLLSLDIGDKRIGIAISESGILANELTTIENNQTAFIFIKDLIVQRKIMGGLRSKNGAYLLERISTMLTTWKKQNLPLFSTLKHFISDNG